MKKKPIIERINDAIAVNRYMREQKELRRQQRSTADPRAWADIKSQLDDIDERIRNIRGETVQQAESLSHEAEELASHTAEHSRAGKWAAGIAAASAIVGGGWALYLRNRHKEEPREQPRSNVR